MNAAPSFRAWAVDQLCACSVRDECLPKRLRTLRELTAHLTLKHCANSAAMHVARLAWTEHVTGEQP